MTALAIAGLITAVATTAVVSLYRQSVEMRRTLSLHDEGKILLEAILPELQAAGGASVRPWMAVSVDPQGAAQSDVLWLTQLDESFRDCIVTEAAGVNLSAATSEGNCCLGAAGIGGRQITVVSASGNRWVTLNPTALDLSDCSLQASTGNIEPTLTQLVPATAEVATGAADVASNAAAFVGGRLGVLRTTRFYRTTSHELVREELASTTGSGFRRVLADRVYDFQVALGYDVGNADGVITDNGNTADEVLGNAIGDAMGTGGLTGAVDDALRTVQIGIVHGTPLQLKDANRAKVLDGPWISQPKTLLRSTIGTAAFRNLYIYQ